MKNKPNRYSLSRDKQAIESDNRQIRQDVYMDACSWQIPFGKHRGKPICAVPLDYLIYIRHATNNLNTAKRATEEIERRKRINRTKTCTQSEYI
jgi:hypothetical protein